MCIAYLWVIGWLRGVAGWMSALMILYAQGIHKQGCILSRVENTEVGDLEFTLLGICDLL